MGGDIEKQADSEFFTKITFQLNLLICGDYDSDNIENNLTSIKEFKDYNSEIGNYIKSGKHKFMKEWDYYFFPKDSIEENTFKFIENKITTKNDYKNLIIFYCGENSKAEDLLRYYEKKAEIYHPQFIIITNKKEFKLNEIKNINPAFIRIILENDKFKLLINVIEICSYFNELGDEVGFPKKIIKDELLDIDSKLMSQYLFTINFLICGKPGSGKSLFINTILGQNKCISRKSEESSLTTKIVKYIHKDLPIVLYDSPGFDEDKDIELVEKLITDKKKNLKEQKSKIHFILYLMNTNSGRGFKDKEIEFIKSLIDQNMEIFFIATQSQNENNSKDYIEAVKLKFKKEAKDLYAEHFKKLSQRIFPVELKNIDSYKKFGLKKLFEELYKKMKSEKITFNINENNLKNISSFCVELRTKNDILEQAKALSLRIIDNFCLLATSLGTNINVKGTTMLSTAVIKIISKIYNINISKEECLTFIEENGYTNEINAEDNFKRKIQKFFSSIFYKYGPAAKEITFLGEKLIEKYNNILINNKVKLYQYINQMKESINNAIDSLLKIHD